MTESEERAYEMGVSAAMRRVFQAIVKDLGPENGSAERWRLERGAAVATLRGLCEDFGDNDWPDDLHLSDVIEKHLGRQLHERGSCSCPCHKPGETQLCEECCDGGPA